MSGIRRDVAVVCLALANTEWYMRQLRELPVRPFDDAAAPALWRGKAGAPPPRPLHTMTDAEIHAAVPERLAAPLTVRLGPLTHVYPAGTILNPSDVLALRVVQENVGRRPIVWSAGAGQAFAGLTAYMVQQGLGFGLDSAAPDAPGLVRLSLATAPLDLPLTERLLDSTGDTARARAAVARSLRLDPTPELEAALRAP